MRALFLLLAILLPSLATAEGKVALVIGNDAYTQVTALERAVSDARAYRDMLANERGFEVVYAEDADRDVMIGKIGEFLGKLRRDDTAMVVYSGHGVQLDPNRGDSLYLLPIDIPAVDPGAGGASFFMDSRAINFARLSSEVEARGAGLRLFVLDACRNNPFPPTAGGRSIGLTRGLGNIRSNRGEFVFFAAAPGEVALDLLPGDDDSANSVFTRVFLKHFREGSFLEDVANDVQEEVLQLSRRASISQEPYYTDGVAGKTCIDAECGINASTPEAPVLTGANELEQTYWRLCETRDTLSYCRAYLTTFPEGQHAPLAQLRVEELESALAAIGEEIKPRVVTVAPATTAEPALEPTQPVDTAALVPDATVGDAAETLAQPTFVQPAAPQPAASQPAVDPLVVAPVPEPEPETVIAAVSPTEPVPSYQDQQREDDARLLRERETANAWAALENTWDIRAIRRFKTEHPGAEQIAAADQRIAYLKQQHRAAQAELNRLGYNAGPVDGDWGKRSARALRAFQSDNGLSRSGIVSAQSIARLKRAASRVVAAPAPEPAQPAVTPSRSATAATPAPQAQPQPADDTQVAIATPSISTIGIPDGATWRANAVTSGGSTLSAKMSRRGDRLKLKVKFDHRTNPAYFSWLIDQYTKSCTGSVSDQVFECWFHGKVSTSRPDSPGAKVYGRFPNLRLEAHNLIGTAQLKFRP